MPIKPQPFVLECPKCHWSKAFAPKSDCMIRGLDWVSECPVCGHEITHHFRSLEPDSALVCSQ